MAIISSTTPTSNHIAVGYYWFKKHVAKNKLIQKIESENQKAYIFTKGVQGELFSVLGNCYSVGKSSYERGCSKKWHIHS